MKRTQVNLDESLLEEALRRTEDKSVSAVINRALREFVRREKQTDILKLKGIVQWEGDLAGMRTTRKAS